MEDLTPKTTPEGSSRPEWSLDWGDIERDMIEETPKEDDFGGVYSRNEINRDKDRVADYKRKKSIEGEIGISDSRLHEYAIIKEIEESDWFGDQEREESLFTGENSQEIIVTPTSEFDDYMNHIDAICVIKNDETKSVSVPFALDMTYNKDEEGLSKKMSHCHPKIKIPGFAAAKYFEDTFSFGKPVLKKGRISIMPRFVIGYSPELSTKVTELRMSSGTWDSLQREEFSTKAKWCVLRELKAQSEQMLSYLETHGYGDDHETLFGKAYSEVRNLDKYFGAAIEIAKAKDQNHPEWETYADRDPVVGAILAKTETMFD